MIRLSFLFCLTAILQLHFMLSESLGTGLAARVEELENQSNAMLQQLSEYKAVNEAILHKLVEYEEMNEHLKKTVNVLSNTIKNIHPNASSNYEKKRQAPEEAVAFTAYISNNPSHLYHGQIIPYDRTVTNIGDAFNIYSHTFICPISGLYMFSYVVCQLGTANAEASLVVDGVRIVDAITNPITGDHDQQGVNMAFVQLRKGQEVHVMNYFYDNMSYRSDESHRFASFSGVLLQEM